VCWVGQRIAQQQGCGCNSLRNLLSQGGSMSRSSLPVCSWRRQLSGLRDPNSKPLTALVGLPRESWPAAEPAVSGAGKSNSKAQVRAASHASCSFEANPPQVIGTVLAKVGIRQGGPGPDQGGWASTQGVVVASHKARWPPGFSRTNHMFTVITWRVVSVLVGATGCPDAPFCGDCRC